MTWKAPRAVSSSMSSTLASRYSAASSFACLTTSSEAPLAAAPPICVDFEPYVPVPCATASVSPLTTSIFSIGRPSRSLAIIANVVSCPCPCEKEPVRTIAPPSSVISTSPNSASPTGFVISVYVLIPIPSSVVSPASRRRFCSARSAS